MSTYYCFVLLLTTLIPSGLCAQWLQLPGPEGVEVNSFSSSEGSSVMYAAGYVGLYRSVDSGAHWSLTGFSNTVVYAALSVVSNGRNVVFAVTDSLYRSLDTGRTWSAIGRGVYMLDKSSHYIFEITDSLCRSSDLGSTWESFPLPPDSTFAGVGGVVTGGDEFWIVRRDNAVYHTNLDNVFFTPVASQFIPLTFAEGRLLALSDSGICYSTDGGMNWTIPANVGIPPNTEIEQIAAIGQTIVVVGRLDLYVSTDYGNSWMSMEGRNGFPKSSYNKTIHADNGIFYCGGRAGTYTSKDGLHWKNSSDGEHAALIYDLASYKGKLFAATESGVAWSTDRGMHWSQPEAPNDLADSGAYLLQRIGGDLYASSNGLWKYDGANWVTVSDVHIAHITEEGSTWYAARDYSKPVFSTDAGKNWTAFGGTLDNDTTYSSYVFPAYGKLFATVYSGRQFGVYGSGDHGVTWSLLNSIDASGALFFTDTPFGPYFSTQRGLYRSTDQGASWTRDPFFNDANMGALASINNGIVAGMQADRQGKKIAGLYFSADGIQWTLVGDTMQDIGAFANDGEFSYIGTSYKGAWRLPMIPNRVQPDLLPSSRSITIYPNPASNIATLTLPGDRSGNVIKLFNELGELVRTYPSITYPGVNQDVIRFDLSGLCDGTYNIVVTSTTSLTTAHLVVRR